ncbi:MAG: phospholipase [Alteromonadaceae bacterium]|nr:phospholipase [Alteromonadaceae bacterium]
MPEHYREPLNTSAHYYNYLQPSFKEYLQATEDWLPENRTFLSFDHDKELAMNMPFELGNKDDSDKAILLVHGLGDSPYSFSDVAKRLNNQGFYVQVLLLPGHGSKPYDLTLPNYNDWQVFVDHYANLLKKEFDDVWLGRFSTGGNLVTIHAITNNDIDGLVLFSPGFQSNIPVIEKFAPIASMLLDVLERNEVNLVKYSSGVPNGGYAYTKSASIVRGLFEKNVVTIPTLPVISEEDSAVDSESVKALYLENFQNHKNNLVWYGNAADYSSDHEYEIYFSMALDQQQISTGSHVSPLFAPNNKYYGRTGERRMCQTKFKKEEPLFCPKPKADVWYAAWGYQEEGKKHTRLTWNPYYSELEQILQRITE